MPPDQSRPPSGPSPPRGSVLWIGAPHVAPALSRSLARDLGAAAVVPVGLTELDRPLIVRLAPHAALSLLAWPGGDALEAAQRLAAAGFAGPYRAVSPALPDRAVIEAEIRAQVPRIDFAVIELAALRNGTGPA